MAAGSYMNHNTSWASADSGPSLALVHVQVIEINSSLASGVLTPAQYWKMAS